MSLQDTGMMKQSMKANITYNYPEENIQHTEHGESLKSRITYKIWTAYSHVKFNHNIRKTYLCYTKEKIDNRDQWQANYPDQYVDIYPLNFYV
jgi:hypothetical protein